MERSKNRLFLPVILLVIFMLVGGGIYIFFGKKNFISPVPPEPNFQVIFYTPTPGATTPTSTPSATPKVKKTSTPVPTKSEETVTPTVKATKATPTLAPKTSPSPTGKSSPSPTV